MSREHLATYLNDHLAGSLIAVQILEHLESEATDLIQDLGALKAEIEADRRQLKELLDRLGISESRVRKVTSWITEQVTEAKFEADDESRGTLRRLERLESLALGIDCEYFDLLDLAQGYGQDIAVEYGQHDTDSRGVLHVLLARKLRMDNDRSHRRERNFLVDAVERGDGDVNCFSAGCLYVHAEISCRRRQLDPFTRLLRLAAAAPSTTRASSKEKAQSSS